MSDDEVLMVVGTIAGEEAVVVATGDWKLLAAVFRKREGQQATIREILREKRPATEAHIRDAVAEIFEREPEDDASQR
jgi:hypothetical protein